MTRAHCRGLALLMGILTALWAVPAAGESPYELDPAFDVPAFLLGGAAMTPAFLEVDPPACLPNCSAAGINAFDRGALGLYSPTARQAADVAVLSLAAMPLVLDLVDSGGDGWLTDAVLFGQTLVLTQGSTQLVKLATRRNAPFVYDDDVPLDVRLEDRDGSRSFWSGHAATAFAAATFYSVTFWKRHPRSPWRWFVIGAGGALASSVALLKLHAGYHYPSDLLAGAAAGIGTGLFVPIVHFR